MKRFLDTGTLLLMASAFIMALLCIWPETYVMFPISVIAAGAHIADTLFHEMGHTLANWLFGVPAIPMIFTLFGADQAAGMTQAFGRSWVVQIVAFAALIHFCYQLRKNNRRLFIPAVGFTIIVFLLAITRYYLIVVLYMGHGGSIMVGAFFLFRAWIYLDARNTYERWLNAFFGFFLTLYNMQFSYELAFNASAREDYSDHVAFGISHNDFLAMTEEMYSWSVRGIGIFTIGYGIAAIIGSFFFALYLRNEFIDG